MMIAAFCIEGSKSGGGSFTEIKAAVKLAEANSAQVFDSVVSRASIPYDIRILSTLPKEKWSLLAMAYLVDFAGETSIDCIVSTLIKPVFDEMIRRGELTTLPEWLTSLTSLTVGQFISEQIKLHFKGSQVDWKGFLKELHKTMGRISDEMSEDHLLSYLRIHPEITHVYGLIGIAHLTMLDTCKDTTIEQKNETSRILRLNIDGREVHIELYGGIHGTMAHFEAMCASCEKDGLVIPSPRVETGLDITSILRLLSLGDSIPARKMSVRERDSAGEEELERHGEEKIVFDLDACAEKFDYWMKNYTHDGSETHSQELVVWLSADSGARAVPTYEDFARLAEKLNTMGYTIPTPPLKEEFERGKDLHEQRRSGEEKLERHGEEKIVFDLDACAEKFDYWMKNYTHDGSETHSQELVVWLSADSGARAVPTYEDFARLAEKLNTMGYTIPTPPLKEEFERGKDLHEQRQERRMAPKRM